MRRVINTEFSIKKSFNGLQRRYTGLFIIHQSIIPLFNKSINQPFNHFKYIIPLFSVTRHQWLFRNLSRDGLSFFSFQGGGAKHLLGPKNPEIQRSTLSIVFDCMTPKQIFWIYYRLVPEIWRWDGKMWQQDVWF